MTMLYLTQVVLARCVAYEQGDCKFLLLLYVVFAPRARPTHTSYAVAVLEPFEQEIEDMQG